MTFLWLQSNSFRKKKLIPNIKEGSLSQQLIFVYNILGLQGASDRNTYPHSAREEPDAERLSDLVTEVIHSKTGIRTWIIQRQSFFPLH